MPSIRSIFGPLLSGSSSKKGKATTADAATQANTDSPPSSSFSSSSTPDSPTIAAGSSSSRPDTPTPTYSVQNPRQQPLKRPIYGYPPRVVSSRPGPPTLFKHARSNDPVLLRNHDEWANWRQLAEAQATLCGINVQGESILTRPKQATLFEFYPWLVTDFLMNEKERAKVRTLHNSGTMNEWTEWIPNRAMEEYAEEKALTPVQKDTWTMKKKMDKERLEKYTKGLWAYNEWKGWVRRTVSSEILKEVGDMEGQDVRLVLREVERVLARMNVESSVRQMRREKEDGLCDVGSDIDI
ncbi:hypothetical protein QBC38DRAFT_84998 [Podospora fimiseda]|uniref:Uncharacterized protein n=1 Tax=Podospora fimiseda TaxID=252190 RepID=A0AAN7BUD6_9PEZI|nr:hypothetical protein QBC38DRAFT_84998 [Podospora fimiseda]